MLSTFKCTCHLRNCDVMINCVMKSLTVPEKAVYWNNSALAALYNSSSCQIWMAECHSKYACIQSNIIRICANDCPCILGTLQVTLCKYGASNKWLSHWIIYSTFSFKTLIHSGTKHHYCGVIRFCFVQKYFSWQSR